MNRLFIYSSSTRWGNWRDRYTDNSLKPWEMTSWLSQSIRCWLRSCHSDCYSHGWRNHHHRSTYSTRNSRRKARSNIPIHHIIRVSRWIRSGVTRVYWYRKMRPHHRSMLRLKSSCWKSSHEQGSCSRYMTPPVRTDDSSNGRENSTGTGKKGGSRCSTKSF